MAENDAKRALESDAGCAESQKGMPWVSILVPVYNAGEYLRPCMETLVGQTLRDIEVICIDDGSTDGSDQVLAEYAADDSRVRVISKENTGYGDSMNRGLAAARGTWIGICEPDDFCDVRMYAHLVGVGELLKCDIVKGDYRTHAEDAGRDERRRALAGLPLLRPFNPVDVPQVLLVDPSIWSAVYRRAFLEENGIRFAPTPGASFQDASFAHRCWMSARRAVLLPTGYYHYRVDNAAASSKSSAKVFAACDEFDRSVAFLRERGEAALRAFGPWLTIARQSAYVWNYNRIDPSLHRDFAARWVADLVAADDLGILDYRIVTPSLAALLGELLADPEAFCRAHPGELEYPAFR